MKFRFLLFTSTFLFLLGTCKNPLGSKNVIDEASGTVDKREEKNTAPSISSISDQSIIENNPTTSLAVQVNDEEQTLDCSNSLSVSSNNEGLVSSDGIALSGTVPNCSLIITPNTNTIGNAIIEVTVSDGKLSQSTNFNLEVTRVLQLSSGSFRYSNDAVEANCKDYFDSSYYSTEGDGTYWIDPDGEGGDPEFAVFCDMTTAGGGWTKVFYHDTGLGTFSNKTSALNFNQLNPEATNRYSILNLLASLKSASDFEFYMSWPNPEACNPSYHHWTQTSNPVTTTESVSGFNRIGGATGSVTGSAGLCLSSNGATLLDGNCGVSNWWYAVGQVSLYGGKIPACGQSESEVQLLVR